MHRCQLGRIFDGMVFFYFGGDLQEVMEERVEACYSERRKPLTAYSTQERVKYLLVL
ncbi:MAG: hypothetical protein ILNGONEN_00690 [Syntrophorhabdaceae bacterium]|nr:hypothetical protein [Syntrophorhabdaceae bacterium]